MRNVGLRKTAVEKLVHEDLVDAVLARCLDRSDDLHFVLKTDDEVVLVAHLEQFDAIGHDRNVDHPALAVDAQFRDQQSDQAFERSPLTLRALFDLPAGKASRAAPIDCWMV